MGPSHPVGPWSPRSYIVTANTGQQLRRNRIHIRDIPQEPALSRGHRHRASTGNNLFIRQQTWTSNKSTARPQGEYTPSNSRSREDKIWTHHQSSIWLVSYWCFEPSQPQRTTSGLNTQTSLYLQLQVIHFTSHFTTSRVFLGFFFSLFIFCGHSTCEPASSSVTYFILWVYTGTMC